MIRHDLISYDMILDNSCRVVLHYMMSSMSVLYHVNAIFTSVSRCYASMCHATLEIVAYLMLCLALDHVTVMLVGRVRYSMLCYAMHHYMVS